MLLTLSASACGTNGGINPAYLQLVECGQWRPIGLPKGLPEALEGQPEALAAYLVTEAEIIAHDEYGEARGCWGGRTPQDDHRLSITPPLK